uniref:Uncharacterized protein n=1 Tax=Mola mola TaxID=94237 RepID=A0A3Q3XQJ6_MOLML
EGFLYTFFYYLILFMLVLLPSFLLLSKHIDHRNLFTQRVCCKRQSHFVYIGQDISGSPVSMRARGAAAPESPEPQSQLPSCGLGQLCQPTGMRVDRVFLFEGPREVEVIQECQCELKLSQCVRVPALKTYYSETPYEAVIDVGGCSRSKEGFSCVPTKFDSALVETPNKADLIQTVVACELKESCYRVPYVEYYYEIVHNAGGVKEERLKEIDVGRCLGGCTTGNRCLLRSPSDPEMCHLWAERQSSSCVPQGYESHSFVNQHGQMRTVLSITSCLCQK